MALPMSPCCNNGSFWSPRKSNGSVKERNASDIYATPCRKRKPRKPGSASIGWQGYGTNRSARRKAIRSALASREDNAAPSNFRFQNIFARLLQDVLGRYRSHSGLLPDQGQVSVGCFEESSTMHPSAMCPFPDVSQDL